MTNDQQLSVEGYSLGRFDEPGQGRGADLMPVGRQLLRRHAEELAAAAAAADLRRRHRAHGSRLLESRLPVTSTKHQSKAMIYG